MRPPAPMTRRALFLFLVITVFTGLILFLRLGERPFRNPDEGRYAVIAHEMVQSGDWAKPTLYGISYLRKPPLFYWLTAASFRVFGESERSARAVPAFFGLMGVWLVFFFTRRYFDERSAVFASLILATNVWFVQVSRYLIIDSVFSFFLTACLFLFYAALHSKTRRRILFFFFYLSLGFAFLTKGPAALAVVGFSVLAYFAWSRRWRELGRMGVPWGIVLFSLVALPWFFVMEHREPGFFAFFFGHENIARFTSATFEHQESWAYYFIVLPLLFLPWSAYWQPWKKMRSPDEKENDAVKFVLISVAATVLFYSFSRSKLPTYILPCLPLLAVVLGQAWARRTASEPSQRWVPAIPVIILMVAAVVGMTFVPSWHAAYGAEYPIDIVTDIRWIAGACLTGGVLCLRSLIQRRSGKFFISWILTLSAISFILPHLMETVNPFYTTKSFAATLKKKSAPGDEVFVYDHPGVFYDLEFYLGRAVRPVGLEGELEHARSDPKAKEIAIEREDLFQRLRDGKRLFLLMRRSDFNEMDPELRKDLTVLKENARKVLVSSGPTS